MKILSILITLQGVSYFIQSILGLYIGTELKIGVQQINANYNIVGVILGVWLIVSGVGIWLKKRYAYNSTIIVYSLIIIYSIISVVYILATQSHSNIINLIVISVILCGIFFTIIKYIQKNKHEFK